MIRIALIVAILAGLGVGVLNFVVVKDKVTTIQTNLTTTSNELVSTKMTLAKTERDLKKTQTDLAQTKQTLDATTAQLTKATADKDAAITKASQLDAELTKTKSTLSDAQAELGAYKATGLTPQQIIALDKNLKQAQDTLAAVQAENTVLGKKIDNLQYKLAKFEGNPPIVELPSSCSGKIVASDPKYNFVVLNFGDAQGAKEDGELLVSRDGKLVAKLIIRSIQKDRCIANVVAGWRLGEPMEGDQVIPAHLKAS